MQVLGEWLLTPERVAVHLPTETAVVADLHLGYDEARRRSGEAIPQRSVESELKPLRRSLDRHSLRRLIFAGDLLESSACRETCDDLSRWLASAHIDWCAIVPGNHDTGAPSLQGLSCSIHESGVELGGWQIVHGDERLPDSRVVHGHEHPWVAWNARLGGPCYLVAERRLVLPAYSADAAGVNVLGARRWREFNCCVIAGDQVLDFGLVSQLRRRSVK